MQNPLDTTVCQDDDAAFTCVAFIPSGAPVAPGWLRNSINVDMMRHNMISNLTEGTAAPVFINSTVTVNKVRITDDGVLYQCGIVLLLSSSATLNVEGECSYTYVYIRTRNDLKIFNFQKENRE